VMSSPSGEMSSPSHCGNTSRARCVRFRVGCPPASIAPTLR
jgi:hypothetical protein